MISGYCEEKYNSVKKIFEDYFLKHEEIGASFAIYKEGKPLIDLWGGFKKKDDEKWEENTIVNVFSATKGIYEIIVSILIDQNILDLEKYVSYYWDAFKKNNKNQIKLKHILSHQSGLYRFKEKITQRDLLDWNKIISILENQDPDHKAGEKTYYHAKTHGFLIGEIIRRTTKKSLGQLLNEIISKKLGLDFYIGTPQDQISNIAYLYQNTIEKNNSLDFNAFNNPEHDINFYNTKDWQTAQVPAMNGHGNARSIAKIYDVIVNDLILDKKNLLSQKSLKKCLKESSNRIDQSLKLPIRWTDIGLILRGGWLFGKNKESFGHNGWGGSVGFADPNLGIGISYTTNKIYSTITPDTRVSYLLKKFYEIEI
jgi:CubicO group peptidase (beta-lactamase class C family)